MTLVHCKTDHFKWKRKNVTTGIVTFAIFRDATYYYRGDVMYRDLFDVYAIHFIIKVTGEARKFDFILMCLCLGSGLAFLTIVSK